MNRSRPYPLVLGLLGVTCLSVHCFSAQAQEAPDGRTIILRSVGVYPNDYKTRSQYTYTEQDTTTDLDAEGGTKAVHTKATEILTIGGKPYTRVLSKDGHALPPGEERKECERIDKAVEEAKRLNPAQLAAREAEEVKRERADYERRKYVPDAFEWKLVGVRVLNGRPAWEVRGTPRPSYHGKFAPLLRNLQGTVFIDQQDLHWVRVEATALKDISLGFFIARVAQGSVVRFDDIRINDEVWLPFYVGASARARFLIKRVHQNTEIVFGGYRRFQTDSRLVSVAQ